MLKAHRHLFVIEYLLLLIVLALLNYPVHAQKASIWMPPERIPGINNSTDPPILIPGTYGIVHAFYSQPFGGVDGQSGSGIYYNTWNSIQGWTEPVNVLLPPLRNTAFVMGAARDQSDIIHIVIWSGNNLGAEVYYSQARADKAGDAAAWLDPIVVGGDASTPNNAALAADDNGNIFILYGGNRDGNGLYAVTSNDNGYTWSAPKLIFQTGDNGLLTSGLKVDLDKDGWLHATWLLANLAGQGRAVYYSRLNIMQGNWSDPIELGQVQEGYGILYPAIIKFDSTLYSLYYVTPKIVMRLSSDDGQTWSDPVTPFLRHVGVNGTLSLAIDGADRLHLFFGQRIPGNPDIHGLWHSIWQDGSWSAPEAVVSRPRNMSGGNNAFDPFDASAAVGQGNTILATWRTDPGNGIKNENGVWYSYQILELPGDHSEEISKPQITMTPVTPNDSLLSTDGPENDGQQPTLAIQTPNDNRESVSLDPIFIASVGILPVVFLIIGIFIARGMHK